MKRRVLVKKLLAAGFVTMGGTNHEHFVKGNTKVMVPRHREVTDQMAKVILKQAGLY